MRFVIQRVQKASVAIDGKLYSEIGKGFLVLAGMTHSDTKETADKMVKKMQGLRIFEDGNGKTNLSLADVSGELLIVSQFTLYADCKRGNRPSFTDAALPEQASSLYGYILEKSREYVPSVKSGVFGADMKVELLNDGPFTVILDSEKF